MTREIDYVEEAGPGVLDLSEAPTEEHVPAADVVVEPPQLWEQETIETFLRGLGVGLHMIAGAGEKDWLMTKADLERIAPPLTRISNRYEPVLRLSPYADPLLVAHGFALYGWRSTLERKRALRDAQENAERSAGYEPVESSGAEAMSAERNGGGPAEDLDDLEDLEDGALTFPESPRATQP
jgi:hypothetical protein